MILKNGHFTGNIIKIVMVILFALSLSFMAKSIAHADENVNVIEDVKINGDDVGIESYQIEGTISPNSNAMAPSRFTMTSGSTIDYDITWSPRPGIVRVGIYNHNTEQITWTSSGSTPRSGTITINNPGLYSFIVGNTTDTTINVSGTYDPKP